jgi:hypothetical protein
MSVLKTYLAPDEQVVDRISPIKFKDISFDCAITNQGILLYRKDKMQFTNFKYASINQISLEKEWYNEFFLGAIIALILGLIWFISATVYNSLDVEVSPPIMVIRALLYPGLVLTCLGSVGLWLYYTRMKIHIQILTPEEKFQLYSKEDRLGALLQRYEDIKSGEITLSRGIVPEIPNEQRLAEKPLATFNNIGIKITFKDEFFSKKSIDMNFSIRFTENFMQMTSKRLETLKESIILKKTFETKTIPLITEENLKDLFEIAHALQINWILLANFNFPLPKISLQTSHFLTGFKGSDSILLKLESPYGQIALELKKSRLYTNAPAPEIVEIEKFLNHHLKKY